MPELPEVEVFRRTFAERGVGHRIESVRLDDPGRLRGARPDELRAALEQDRFAGVRRHGKILFAETGGGAVLVMHFGMTGELRFPAAGEAEPEGAVLRLTFADGSRLAVLSRRKLGWVELAEDAEDYLSAHRIGPDALEISAPAFAERIGAGRGSLKSALMDQSKIAGIGNVYSDEILFRAGLLPRGRGQDLGAAQLGRLHATMQSELERAIETLASGRDLPEDWLAQHREKGARCPRCGTPLRREKISGRSAYFCPRCQGLAGT
ncbi:MAG: Fpg/Nei family DNA glycosylase [Paracoccaceae bacterium]